MVMELVVKVVMLWQMLFLQVLGGEVLSRGMSTATTIPASEDELRTFMASCFHLHGQFFQSENLPQKVQRHHGISHETTT